ncbi:hypothetical protein FQR65_LT17125 [Abscondita terminalis]|nr:hypothetical protein FQR65_LT17125 [Abscondita terminalis]
MNFNANTGARQSTGRKVKRVSDVNAMGYNPYNQQQPQQQPPFQQNANMNSSSIGYNATTIDYGTPVAQNSYISQPQPGFEPQPPNVPPQFNPYGNAPQNQIGNVFAQPIVQDMAYQYGQQLANQGKTMVTKGIEQYVAISRLKYYFAVDTKYVISKLGLLLFPFMHSDWSVKYEQEGDPIQPRFEVNAPDLYIPTMAYFTYVLVAGLMLGMQQRFTPEQIVMQASSALAWCIVELAVYSCTRYIINLQSSLHTMDLLAYSGYKFVGIIASILISLVGGRTGYYALLAYVNLALAFFLVRSLKAQVLQEKQVQYYAEVPTTRNKRRLYFLLLIAVSQPVLSWLVYAASFAICLLFAVAFLAVIVSRDTIVIVGVYGPIEVKNQKLLISKASVETHYRPKTGTPGIGDRLYETTIQNICETALVSALYPRSSIVIIIQEMQNCGGIISCAVNACCFALLHSGIDMKFLVASAGCALDDNGIFHLDPDKYVSEKAKANFVFVFESVARTIVASHTSGSFNLPQFEEALELCKKACEGIFDFYKTKIRSEIKNKT